MDDQELLFESFIAQGETSIQGVVKHRISCERIMENQLSFREKTAILYRIALRVAK